MIRPTRRTLLLVTAGLPVAAVPALFGETLWPVWLGAVGLLLLALLLDLALLPGRRRFAVEAEAPAVAFTGDADPLRLRLRSSLRRPLALDGIVDVTGPVAALAPIHVVHLPPETTELQLPLRPVRRGRIRIDRLWLRWRGPLGLLAAEQSWPIGAELPAVANIRYVKAQALRFFTRREFQLGLRVERFVGDGSEFHALREHVPGFDRRAIDWKASARHRLLLAREYRAERSHDVVLAIDGGRLMAEPLDGIPKLDHAINSALLLGYVCLKTGDLVGVAAFDDRPRQWREPAAGVPSLHRLQRALADVTYSDAETNFTLGLAALSLRLRRRALVVVFTDFADSVTAELMVPNLRRLARRHSVLFVALRDPALTQLAGAAPRDSLDLHRAVVASEFERDRQVVLERIRQAGVQVVDATAAQVGSALISRYLELKRREVA